MIRGPSRGLGTFRCRCRWILLFPLLTTLLLLFAQLNPSQASSVVAERDQSTPAGNYISSKADSGSDTPPTVSIFHQVQIPINMVAGIGGSSSSSGVSQHHHSRFHHHHHQQQQQQHHHQQQQQQQQVAPLVAHGYGGYKPAAPSKESSSGTTEEGSILRLLSKNNLYIQSFPNGTVSATGHDSSFYSVLKLSAIGVGRIYIRGIASRLYLCINECGRLYGSEHLEQDCILRDQIVPGSWFNTYTSIKHSTAEKSLYMAFNSNTGSPCRLRLKSEITSDGSSIVALGSNEKYALFFPVRNISLPDGMNLTSLIQLNKRIPFVKNSVKPTGCAPRCSKLSDQSIKETSSNRAGSKEKSKRKNKCSCLSSETPAQGGGNVERCRRPRQCRQNPGQHNQKKNHGESSSSNIATGSGWKQLKRPERLREKESRNQKRVTTENSASDVNLLSAESRLSPINRLEMDHSPVKWMVESESSQSSGQNEKKATLTTTHQDRSPQRNRNKLKTRRGKKTSTEDRSPAADTVSNPSNSKASNGGRQDRTLRFPHRKSDSRLIRHRYRKIRAHPELAEQLDAMS